jgi:hypothetical protein
MVPAQFLQDGPDDAEEGATEQTGMVHGQPAQFGWQGEHQVEVPDRKDPLTPLGDPLFLGQGLAVWTASFPAAEVDGMHGLADPAHMELRAQGRGAAGHDGAQQSPLTEVQDMLRLQRLAMAPEDVRDPKEGPLRSAAAMRGRLGHGSGRREQFHGVRAALDHVGGHVQVALRAGERAMPEQGLDDRKAGAVLQQQGGMGVAQGMRRCPLAETGGQHGRLEYLAGLIGIQG